MPTPNPSLAKKRVIIGLGNPGSEYERTRHNAGWWAADVATKVLNLPAWSAAPKLHGFITKDQRNWCFKPTTFMNNSGQAVRALLDYYHLDDREQLFVCYDDLDLEVGRYKLQWATGPKVHNGLSSLEQHLGSQEFWHVRIGIDGRQGDRSLPAQNYVLQQPSLAEQTAIGTAIDQAVAAMLKI